MVEISVEKIRKIQHPFMTELTNTKTNKQNTCQTRKRNELPQSDKGHQQNSTANVSPNGERLNAFAVRLKTRQGHLFWPKQAMCLQTSAPLLMPLLLHRIPSLAGYPPSSVPASQLPLISCPRWISLPSKLIAHRRRTNWL